MSRKRVLQILTIMGIVVWGPPAWAFCGFYVAKADTKLFNEASSVAIVRHENKTVLTMSNDFKGDVKEFAMIIPVPTVLQEGQIHVGNQALLEHLDAYSSPRLVEYFDPNPCALRRNYLYDKVTEGLALPKSQSEMKKNRLGVKVEAQYTVGEYDILILSAEESQGLATWLRENNYRIPDGAEAILASYLKQDMKFFVAKVNVKEQAKLGFSRLRPLQMAFKTEKFILPIRLGTVNAQGPQELFVYFITKKGRVETTNYRTVKLPAGKELPVYVKEEFPRFYKDMFTQQVKNTDMRGVFLEYAWNMNWCDPCAADPLSKKELQDLGVFWLGNGPRGKGRGAQDAFITRLHVRYDAKHFPEDLQFQETPDSSNFQARYVLRHPWTGTAECDGVESYKSGLRKRHEREAQTLANLTGWAIEDIREKMHIAGTSPTLKSEDRPWWKSIWGD